MWRVRVGRKVLGPYTDERLHEEILKDAVSVCDEARRDGEPRYREILSYPELFDVLRRGLDHRESVCPGASVVAREMLDDAVAAHSQAEAERLADEARRDREANEWAVRVTAENHARAEQMEREAALAASVSSRVSPPTAQVPTLPSPEFLADLDARAPAPTPRRDEAKPVAPVRTEGSERRHHAAMAAIDQNFQHRLEIMRAHAPAPVPPKPQPVLSGQAGASIFSVLVLLFLGIVFTSTWRSFSNYSSQVDRERQAEEQARAQQRQNDNARIAAEQEHAGENWSTEQTRARATAVESWRQKPTSVVVTEVQKGIQRQGRCDICALGPAVDVLRERAEKDSSLRWLIQAYVNRELREIKEGDENPGEQWVTVCKDNSRHGRCWGKAGCCYSIGHAARLEHRNGVMDCRLCTGPH